MIKSWQHKGLRKFYETGCAKGIQFKHKLRITIILQLLDAAIKPEDLNLPGIKLHQLKGNYKKFYSVSVSGNWRVIYKFDGKDVILVDYLDYH